MRKNYWSCSDFADWLRGTAKPGAETGPGWRKWRKAAKQTHPFRYWLAEEGLDMIQNALWWPADKIYNVKYYINNRWITKTHALTAHPRDIKPGTWCDVGNRFLPCLFNELVDFVEVELAWSNISWDKEARKKYNPPFYARGWFRWRVWRCPEAGLDYLNWAKDLTNEGWLDEDKKHEAELTHQAVAARETIELYNWWKNVYPNRKDPMDSSGWSDYCAERRNKLKAEDPDNESIFLLEDEETEESKNKSREILDLCTHIETEYEREDTEMMVRLIKIRNSLWT